MVAHNYEDALAEAEAWSPDRAVVDLRMPGHSGLELVAGLRRVDPSIAVVVLTIATMYPYLRHRIPEIQAENLTLESARKNAQHATVKSQSAVGESRDSIGSQAADSMTDSPADSRDSQAGEVQDPAADK